VAEARGVLVMAYGTPQGLEDVKRYYTDIRRGRPPPPELLEELVDRYRAIGRSPLLEITEAQARGIEERLGVKTYLGQKHSAPFIGDAVSDMAADGVVDAVGFVLAPHFSSLSIGDYERRVRRAAGEVGWPARFRMVLSWHVEPGYVQWLASEVRTALDALPEAARSNASVVFSAHSLPKRVLDDEDPYPSQLTETAEHVAAAAGIKSWRIGWQSAGRTDEPWLGPGLGDVISQLGADGATGVVVCPCGFVADHLEVLYDVDIEARHAAESAGLAFGRTTMPNDGAEFLDVAAAVVNRRFREP
jgi:protoporphyrin/coproporphyrin ferrochelatase